MQQAYLDHLAVPVAVLDAALRIVYCNTAAITLIDQPPGELRAHSVAELFPEWHGSDLAQAVAACLQTAAPQNVLGWWRGRCFQFQATRVHAGVLLAAHDVTEYQFALQDLREHKTNLSVIMDAISESLGLIAADGTILAINSTGAARLNMTPREVVGTCVFDYYHREPGLAEARRKRIQEALACGNPIHFDDKRDGHNYANWILPVPTSAGQSQRVVVFATDVTDLRRQERHLRASEARYRAIVQDQTELICRFTPDGVLTFVNDAYCSYFGKAPFELLGSSFLEPVPPSEHAGIRAQLATLTPSVQMRVYEHRAQDREGNARWQQWTNRAFFDPQGTLLEYQSVGRDITARKHIEDQLRSANERFNQLAEQSRTMIWEVDADGLYTYVSPAIVTILGMLPDAVIGKKHFYDLHPPENRENLKAAAFEVFARKAEFHNFENQVVTADGRCIWVSTNGIPMLDETGNLIGYRGADTDITDRKHAERALRENTDLIQLLLNSTAEAICGVDLQGVCMFCNAAALRMLKYQRPAQIIGCNLHETIHHTHADGTRMATSDCILLRTLTQDVEAHADNETLWRADGTSFLAECWAYPLRRDHTIVGAVITFVDITDRSRAQLALADSEQRYRALYENLPLATVTWQINGDDFLLINVNQMAEEESNTKADHLIGQHARVLYHDQPAMRDILRDTVQSRTRQQRDIQYISLLRHKLHSITCTCGFVPPDLVIMHIEDITKRRHAESKLRHYQRQLRALAAQITLVEERERRRVAADLHDHVCQTLAAIKLKLGVLAEAIAVKPVAADLHYTMAMLDQCIRATRDLSFDLSPPVLYELGLDAALEWLADHLHTKRLAIRVATNGQPAALTDDLRVLLFIVTREVVINAIKHAAAQTITITRTTAADQLRITVHDDGRGFAKERSTTLRTRRGFGLFSIRERLRNVGGTIDIASAPDAGTTVEIMVPLSHDTERLGGSPAPAEDPP